MSSQGRVDSKSTVKASSGYYGLGIVKPPVWTWEIPLYFFVGGLSGMAAVIAGASALLGADANLVRGALWTALAGALISPVLLIKDLGRPALFYNMLRVLKWQSPMSVGVWLLAVFSSLAAAATLLFEVSGGGGVFRLALHAVMVLLIPSGALLATYTGVLIGATAIPIWNRHRTLLPIHFGVAGLGSASGVLELLGHRLEALHLLGYASAGVETCLALWLELHRGVVNKPLHHGTSAWALRLAALLSGPLAIALRLADYRATAAVGFMLGALLSRYAWIWAGRASAKDPDAVLEASR